MVDVNQKTTSAWEIKATIINAVNFKQNYVTKCKVFEWPHAGSTKESRNEIATDGLPHHNDTMTSAPNVIEQLVL